MLELEMIIEALLKAQQSRLDEVPALAAELYDDLYDERFDDEQTKSAFDRVLREMAPDPKTRNSAVRINRDKWGDDTPLHVSP